MKKEQVKIGMVFTFSGQQQIEYVVTGLSEDTATLERITCRSQSGNRHGSGYGWFREGIANYIRKMDGKELSNYQTSDPICNLEKGIYRARNTIDTLLSQPCISEDEVIKILKVEWDDNLGSKGEIYRLNVFFQQFGKEIGERVCYHSRDKMACVHWFRENFRKLNLYQ